MKRISNLLFLALGLSLVFAACDKKQDLPLYQKGTAVVLTSSLAAVAPAPTDSNNTALTLNWTFPKYAADSASTKYTVQMDTAGRNFTKAYTKILNGSLSTAFIAKDLNTILLSYGYAFGVPVDMDVRVVSSYANNNEVLTSNTVRIKMTPYKVPPKIALPSTGTLFLVGSATVGGWGNPVPAPSQQFARLNETTFAGVFNLTGGAEFLILPLNGDWGHKYAVANKSVANLNAGGDFGLDLNDNFPAPATSGYYTITVDFQSGKFTVAPYTGNLPNSLFIIGDATTWGWNNPVPVATQQFARLNSSQFEGTFQMLGGKEYLLLPLNGSWDHKFAVKDKSLTNLWQGGSFGYDQSANFPGPITDGSYKIQVNFITQTFVVTKM